MQFFMYSAQDVNGPHDLPKWKTIYEEFRRWKKQRIFKKMNYDITKYSRSKMGRNEEPSACIADSQSVKTTEKGGQRLRWRQESQR
jgi:putative transposase